MEILAVNPLKRKFILIGMVILALGLLGFTQQPVLRLSTTTSTENSGLLAWLLPHFEKEAGCTVHVIAVGSGKALKLGENGDVDVVLAHAREDEEKFVAAGYGLYRLEVMYNDFIIVGPAADPAGIRQGKTAVEVFHCLGAGKAPFISRGDDSGTHKMEKSTWKQAALQPTGKWYVEAGQGMGEVLMMASTMQGYTLTDRATYLKMKPKLDLEVLFAGDPTLFNQYGVIPVNPKRSPGVAAELAEKFARWLTSPKGQQLIAQFGVAEFGKPLFFPNAKQASPKH